MQSWHGRIRSASNGTTSRPASRRRTTSSRASTAACRTSFSTRHCSSILMMPAPRPRYGIADFNTARPHSALGYLTPAACAANFTATDHRLRNPYQLRQSPIASPASHGVIPAEAQSRLDDKPVAGQSKSRHGNQNASLQQIIQDLPTKFAHVHLPQQINSGVLYSLFYW